MATLAGREPKNSRDVWMRNFGAGLEVSLLFFHDVKHESRHAKNYANDTKDESAGRILARLNHRASSGQANTKYDSATMFWNYID